MYKSFRVQNFRGFKDLRLDDMARVNLIAGKNNTGKTALLEAIYTYTGVYDTSLLLRISADQRRSFRSFRLEEGTELIKPGWHLLFHNFETESSIQLCGKSDARWKVDKKQDQEACSDKTQQLEISLVGVASFTNENLLRIGHFERVVDEDGRVLLFQDVYEKWVSFNPYSLTRNSTVILVSEQGKKGRNTKRKVFLLPANRQISTQSDAALFTDARRNHQDEQLLALTKKIEPRLKQIELLQNGVEIEIHGHLEGLKQPLPFSSMGEGMRRITSLLLTIATTENGIVLIDEIENGLHHSVQVEVWEAIAEAARTYNVQIFTTTHSYEMIRAAHEAFQGREPFDFRLYRLGRNKDNNDIRVVSYNKEILNATIENNFEMR